MHTFGDVAVRRLDQLFVAPFSIALLKMDVQGFECRVLQGAMRALAASRAVGAVAAEVAPTWLYGQCCAALGCN